MDYLPTVKLSKLLLYLIWVYSSPTEKASFFWRGLWNFTWITLFPFPIWAHFVSLGPQASKSQDRVNSAKYLSGEMTMKGKRRKEQEWDKKAFRPWCRYDTCESRWYKKRKCVRNSHNLLGCFLVFSFPVIPTNGWRNAETLTSGVYEYHGLKFLKNEGLDHISR